MRIIKFTRNFTLMLLVLLVLLISFGIYNNNVEIEPPTKNELNIALNNAIKWLEVNEPAIVKNHNSALWWILREAYLELDNKRLEKLYLNYKHTFLDNVPRNVWSPYFFDNYKPAIKDIYELYPLREYQLLFVYSLSCSANIEDEPVIQKQLKSNYCSNHFLHTRCVTHQLMAVRRLNKTQCGNYEELSSELLKTIRQEITYDFRVTDSYIQRGLMLAESNHVLKPIWISKILAAQQDDGGWADFYPLIKLGGVEVGSASTSFKKGPGKSDFHMTAQAIWFLSLLINQTDD